LEPIPRLIYFHPDDRLMSKGSIELKNIVKVEPQSERDSPVFVLGTRSGRTYILQAETVEEMNDWISVITVAISDSTKERKEDLEPKVQRRESESAKKKPSTTVVKYGWMKKRGEVVKNWKKRYFILCMVSDTKSELKYYVSPDTTLAKGSIGNYLNFRFFLLI